MTTIERGGPRGRRGTKPARREEAPAPGQPVQTGEGAPAEEEARTAPARRPSRKASPDTAETAAKTARKPSRKAEAKAEGKTEAKAEGRTATKPVAKPPAKPPAKPAAKPVADPVPGRAAPRRRAPAKDPRPAPARRPAAPPAKEPRPKAARPKAPAHDGRPRAPFVLLVLCLMGGALVSLLVLNTVLARDSFTLSALQKSERQLIQDKQQLVEDIAREEAPERLAAKAENEGMVQPEQLAFVDPVDGTVTGGKKRPVPSAAAAAAAAAGVIGVPGAIVPGDGIPGYTGTQPEVQTDPAAPGER
ncbi:hypothetical protein EDD29_1466 [Actinocorallia herbida]|uniref:Cell division protein FtsL n=1 Tax=Actinocorallia herbida TaxID=58109 RepID=A0A3N1CRL2_9ACTN|nr:hypothetical protein [Actinocorallia herbida]ROO83956.1 hypothetical protein EDD29_1466 [Actinocorallia herbida]